MQRQSGGYRAYMDPNSSEYNAALAFYDPSEGGSTGSYAFGLERVPYDNYPALLHPGERVLPAREARNQDQGWAGILTALAWRASTDWAGLLVPRETRGLTERTTDGQGRGDTFFYLTVRDNSFGGNMTAEEVGEVIADRMMLMFQGWNRG